MSQLKSRRRGRRRPRASCAWARGTASRCGSSSTSSRSARCCPGCFEAVGERRRRHGDRGRSTSTSRPCATAAAVREFAGRPHRRRRALRDGGTLGRRARHQPAARARVRDRGRRWRRPRRVRRRRRARRHRSVRDALAALVRRGRPAARRAPGEGADARARPRRAHAAPRHRVDGVPARPRRGEVPPRRPRAALPSASRCESPDAEPGTLDLDGDQGVEQTGPPRGCRCCASPTRCRAALDARELTDLYERFELPARARARPHGGRRHPHRPRVPRRRCARISRSSATMLVREIHAHAGEEFNVNSTPQLRTILFEKLGLQPVKKTKTGPSTDADSLQKMADEHPIVEDLLRYREVEKLRCTYADALPPLIARRRPHPRDVQADRHHHRPHLERGAEPAERAGAHRRRARDAARVHRRPTAAGCSPPTTRRSSCASSRTSRRTRASSTRSSAAPTSTPRPPRRSSTCRKPTSTTRSGASPRS